MTRSEHAALRNMSEHVVYDDLETIETAVSAVCDTFSTKNVYFECPKTWWKLLKLALSAVGCLVLEDMLVADQQTLRTNCGALFVTMYRMASGNWELIVYHTGV